MSKKFLSTAALAAVLMTSTSVLAQEAAPAAAVDPAQYTQAVDSILANAKFEAAVKHMDDTYDQLLAEFEELTEIPSGPFMEEKISARYAELLTAAGLTDVKVDEEGNSIGLWKGTAGDGKFLVVSAHLDTVFPEGTDVNIQWKGTEAHAPGVRDDKMSTAILLAYARAMKEAGIQTKDDILFVGTVGEEGPGDLRGVRYLFNEGEYKDKIKGFFSVEGGSAGSATVGGTGSVRYRVHFKGPGGHSFGAFGLVNPAYALADFMTTFSQIQVPANPKTTHSVGILDGGTSVNSIPFAVSAEIDMRSNDPSELDKVHERMKVIADQAVANENARRSVAEGPITVELEQIGLRPAGQTTEDTDIFQMTKAAFQATVGDFKGEGFGSTDSNIPMSLGIPALTIGANSGIGGRGHSLDEWLETAKDKTLPNMRATLAVVLANAGMANE
ncbi:M20/M25/M40 family metallo-hydrolase [Devosia sp. D6-9]|nr:M20/M25/M40 family metallo-hydrolase [Devosia sp. D6-9]